MVSLYLGSRETCLTAEEVCRLLQSRRRLWVWVGEAGDGAPYLRPTDAIELTDDSGTVGGLAIVEEHGRTTVALVFDASAARPLGWVRQIWRGQRRYRLERPPWRGLLRRRAGRTAWLWTDRAFGAAHRLRRLAEQLRPAPGLRAVEAGMEQAYSLPSWIEFYVGQAHSGLWSSEQTVVDRYLRPGDHVLDIGAGVGREAFGFARAGLRVTAVDACPAFIDAARREVSLLPAGCDVSFEVVPLSRLDYPAETFDAVFIASDVYSCIPGRRNRVEVLQRCGRMVRPGGLVVFPVHIPACSSRRYSLVLDGPRRIARRFLGERIPEAGDRWSRFGPEEGGPLLFKHHFFSVDEVAQEIAAAGLGFVERISDFFVLRAPAAAVIPEAHPDVRRYRSSPDVLTESVGDTRLLVHLEHAATYQLNETGSAIWELAVQGHTAAEIAEHLAAEYGAMDAPRLAHDAGALLEELARNDLLAVRAEAVG